MLMFVPLILPLLMVLLWLQQLELWCSDSVRMLMEFSDFAQPKRNEFGASTFQLEAKLSTDIFRFKNRKKISKFRNNGRREIFFWAKKEVRATSKDLSSTKKRVSRCLRRFTTSSLTTTTTTTTTMTTTLLKLKSLIIWALAHFGDPSKRCRNCLL